MRRITLLLILIYGKLQAVFSADGKLIGYSVQKGQGPTQIAKDLNENHANKINGKVEYTDIVYGNLSKFENVVPGDGKVFDAVYLPFLYGIILGIFAIFDYKIFKISLILFLGLLGVLFLDYATGGILLIALLIHEYIVNLDFQAK